MLLRLPYPLDWSVDRAWMRGEKALQVSGRKGLTVHVRKQKAPPSLLQRDAHSRDARSRKPSNDVDNGIVGFGTTEAQPYASMLITQFGGDEFDSGSCLAFAPSHRTGRNGNVTQRDWKVPSPDSDDFVKLEPWAVPCDNQWAKDNPTKWEGYSFYTYESVIEKCAAVTYSLSAQPVISFVGGLEFDILPAPLMEITTEVCWPDRVTAPDLSLIVITARSAGIVLFTHTIRLHRRFGNNTDFVTGNYKDSVERPGNYFGKGTAEDDDKALQVLNREVKTAALPAASAALPSLSQSNASRERAARAAREARHAEQHAERSFRVTQEELFLVLASAKFDHKMGLNLNITARYEGPAAAERVKAALNLAQSQEQALGNHELFELASPSNSLVGFSVIGELAEGMLQLKVRMSFGPIESPTKEIPLVNLVDHLRVVLSAIPFVSQASKQKAIDSMSTTHFEIPSAVTQGALSLANGITGVGGRVREAVLARSSGVCSLEAVLNVPSVTNTDLAMLPEDCRPGKTLILNAATASTNTGAATNTRVDVSSEGVVTWVGGNDNTWLSLSGIVFPVGSGWPLELTGTWLNYGGSFEELGYTRVGSLCFIRGRIKGGAWGQVATLPEDCRPVRQLQFSGRVKDGNVRVDVSADGAVTCDGSGSWLALDGIAFTVDSSIESALSLNFPLWTADTDGSFGLATYAKTSGHCILQGRVMAAELVPGATTTVQAGSVITTLPVDCWPMRQLTFNAGYLLGNRRIGVNVSEFGEVSLITSVEAKDVISLSGILFTAPTDRRRLLPVRSGWVTNRPGSWGEAVFDVKNGLCRIEARLVGGDRTAPGLLAQLPEGCRPTKRLSFGVNRHNRQNRVDVTTSGEVQWMAGPDQTNWIGLYGICFAPGNAGRMTLPLLNGWAPRDGYGLPEVVLRNGFCSVEGAVDGNSNSNVATLPTECHPTRRLVFSQTNDVRARVDVLANGKLRWEWGDTSYGWLGLAMAFVPDESQGVELTLQNGWDHYGGDYGNLIYLVKDGVCALQGMVKNGAENTLIATLPATCRPRNYMFFRANWKTCMSRVDIQTNGGITWRDSSCSATSDGWLSLTGISFSV